MTRADRAASRDQILFVVGGRTQWDDALRVAAELPETRVLDLGTLEVMAPPPVGTPYPGRHWPDQGFRVVRELTRTLRRLMPGVAALVLGQDSGRLPRVAAQVARRAGVPVVVVPDGALFDSAPTLPLRSRLEEHALRWARVAAGRPLEFGSTQPDLWCAWGKGWVPMLQGFSPHGRVEVTGSPRAADLDGMAAAEPVPRRILVCSQPTWVHPFPPSATAGPRWYRWVDRIVRTSPPGAVCVRLHPREHDLGEELGLTDAIRGAATAGTTLAADLAAHDAVVAPFSTVLIEAAAARRRVVSVVPERACLPVRSSSPAMADTRLRVFVADDLPDHAALTDALASYGEVSAWGSSFATISAAAPAQCARAVSEVALRSALRR